MSCSPCGPCGGGGCCGPCGDGGCVPSSGAYIRLTNDTFSSDRCKDGKCSKNNCLKRTKPTGPGRNESAQPTPISYKDNTTYEIKDFNDSLFGVYAQINIDGVDYQIYAPKIGPAYATKGQGRIGLEHLRGDLVSAYQKAQKDGKTEDAIRIAMLFSKLFNKSIEAEIEDDATVIA